MNKVLAFSVLLGVLAVPICIYGGFRVDNRVPNGYYTEKDFSVQCLDGVLHYTRLVYASAFMSPVIDSDTLNRVRCSSCYDVKKDKPYCAAYLSAGVKK